jgi:fucose 4-O-acetylase-like acetyltransferase
MKNPDSRIYFYDNAKFWLIFIVLFVHFLPGTIASSPLDNVSHPLHTLRLFLFMFVMQAFAFVSGFFSKGELSKAYIQKLFITLVIPYIIVTVIQKVLAGQYVPGFLLTPTPIMWYLVALFMWRIALVVALQIRRPILIFLSFLIAITVGYSTEVGTFLTLSRMFVFFPFFLLGYLYGEKLLNVEFKYQKAVGIAIFALFFIVIWNYFPIATGTLAMRESYSSLGVDNYSGSLIRLSLLVLACILSFAFFLLIPKKETYFSDFGARSFFAYMLHPLIILGLLTFHIKDHPPLWFLYSLIPFAFICTMILSSKWSEKIFSYILYPKIVKKLFVVDKETDQERSAVLEKKVRPLNG